MPEPPLNDDDRMGKVLTISLHPYKPLIAIGCHNSTIKLWSLKAKTFVTSVTHPGRIQAVAFSQCGKYLASAGSLVEDGNAVYTIFIWDITFDHNAQPVLVYYDQELSPDTLELLHQGDITSLCFQPTILEGQNCTILASGSHDQTVRLWDFKRMKRLILRQHKAEVTCVSYTDDARFLASGSSDCSVMLWRFIYVPANYNAASGPPTTTPNADCYPFVTQVAHFNAGVNEMVRSLSFFPSYQDIGAITREYVLSVGTSMSVQILRIHDLNIKEDPKMEMLDFFTKIKQYEVMREHLLQQLAAGKRPVELDPNRRINYIHINILSRIPIHDVQTVHASYHETARRDRRIDMMERERHNSTPLPDDDKRSKRASKRAKEMLSNAKDMMSSLVSNSYLGPSIIQTMYIVLGTSTDVQVWMMNEERDNNGDISIISHKTMIGKHEDPIRCVCAPPLTLHKTLVNEGFLRNTLHYAIAGSEHHGVSIFTWSVLPHPTYTRELTPLASRDLDAFITIHTRYGKHSRAVEGEEVIKDIRDMTLEEKQQAVIRMATELDAEDGIIDETHQFDVTTYEHIDEVEDDDDTTKAKSRGITNLAISLGSQEKVNREESSQPSAASIGISHLPPKTVDDILLPPTSEPPQPPRKRPATRSTPQVYSSSTNNIMASQTLIPDPNKKRSRMGASNLTQFNALAANHRTRPRNERSCTTDGDCVVS